jgi:hypothetical protein
MDQELKPDERELIKLVNYFKKRGEILIIENKLGEEYKQMLETCDKLIEQLMAHAKNRQTILSERKQLEGMVRDNAKCPSCESNEMIKVIGVETNEHGWRSNKYKCRRCNITFVWNTPNNPWDMIPYVEKFIGDMELRLEKESPDEESRHQTGLALAQMKANVGKLRPVVEASDRDMSELDEREKQMADMVHKFKKHLLIEKIRLED